MISVTHYRSDDAGFEQRALDALAALAARPGYVRGRVGRSTDEVSDWVLVTEWRDVGSYRRALGAYDVRIRANGLLGEAIELPSSFESLAEVGADGNVTRHGSDRSSPGGP